VEDDLPGMMFPIKSLQKSQRVFVGERDEKRREKKKKRKKEKEHTRFRFKKLVMVI
jgi:hypothetical protein